MTNQNQRKSFILHKDSLDILDQLNDEQAGRLFKAIFQYQKTGDFANLDQFTKIILTPFISQFKRDEDKWLNVVERNKANIAKRWNTKNTTGKTGIPKNTKNTDSDSKSDSKSDIKEISSLRSDTKKVFIKPTLQEIQSYCQERRNSVNPEKWLNHYESNGWKVGKNPMKDWKAAVRTWENSEFSNPEQKPTDSLATQINQIIGQDLISKVYETTRDDEKVTEVKFNTMHDRDRWLKLPDETRQKAKDIILAKFKNQKMRMA